MKKRNKGKRKTIYKVFDKMNNLLYKCFNKYDANSKSTLDTRIEIVNN